ncbi:MAG: endonuclease domain-containing protein [Coleofasciculus sp. B1-GNL1-01]|uniref:endonuclease domain-containing protein n=1 Tax=Coleofasciculus sp. B1-GNL1-01 TaxID=3068484 RepID=UPI0032F3D6CF
MTKLYNRTSEKKKRQVLRQNMTSAEKLLWSHRKGKQIEGCKFRRQYSVAQFIIDFYSPEIQLAIEVDGDSHFQTGVPEYDKERQQFIESTRITFLRFINDDVQINLSSVCEVIRHRIIGLRQEKSVLAPLSKGGLGGLNASRLFL